MRHVADETDLACIATDDFRPLVPRGGSPAGHEERQQLVRTLAPSEAHERAHVAQLVRRVVLPWLVAVAPIDELAPVPLERRPQQLRRNRARVSGRRQCDRRRRRIEVPELRCAGQIVDAVRRRRSHERCGDVARELVALCAPRGGAIRFRERFGDCDRGVVAFQRPQIIPVRVHRLFRIALVTDRCRQQPEQLGSGRSHPRSTAGLAHPFDVAHRGIDVRPHRREQRAIAGVAIDVVHEEDELAGAVVFGDRIGAARVDAARHLAVGELVRRIPAQVVSGDVGTAEAQQRLADHRAVANPRARVSARARPQDRSVAFDQQVRECGSQRVDERLRRGGHVDRDARERPAPCRGRVRLLQSNPRVERARRDRRRARRSGQRYRERDGRRRMRCQRDRVAECRRRVAE